LVRPKIPPLVKLARSVNPHVKAVLEPSANYWLKIYDKLEDEGVEVKLSNPSRTKVIDEARVKMDKIDARMLAYLLRGDLVAESYVPTKKNRERRSLIRHRASLMRMRTEIKNRTHAILDKHDLPYDYTDLFGKQGTEWLRNLQLPTPDHQILQSNLQILETLNAEIQNADIQIAKDAATEDQAKLLMTMLTTTIHETDLPLRNSLHMNLLRKITLTMCPGSTLCGPSVQGGRFAPTWKRQVSHIPLHPHRPRCVLQHSKSQVLHRFLGLSLGRRLQRPSSLRSPDSTPHARMLQPLQSRRIVSGR
jgi:hypothetical protein